MTSLHTFESDFRRRLLDIVYAQWRSLGAPFVGRLSEDVSEVVDPEALLWCSIEFVPAEPRLGEALLEWVTVHRAYLASQRLYKIQKKGTQDDPRAVVWRALDRPIRRQVRTGSKPSTAPGEDTGPAGQFDDLCGWILARRAEGSAAPRFGRFVSGPGALLLRARDMIGQDIRHFLLVYLVANQHGGKLRDIEQWSGYAYRSLSEAAARWEAAEIATLDSGFCRLTSPDPWRALLHLRTSKVILVNWLKVFGTSVGLLRDLARARDKGLDPAGPVNASLVREAARELSASVVGGGVDASPSVGHLLNAFPDHASRLSERRVEKLT